MNSNFSKQELNERLLDLLYGLLDDDEAEETRRLVASDADAAKAFDEARETAGLLARAARAEINENVPIQETARNVAVDPLASPFAFDAAVGAFGKGVFQPASNGVRRDENRTNTDVLSLKNDALNVETKEEKKARKKRERVEKKFAKSVVKLQKSTLNNADAPTSGDWATVGRTPNATSPIVDAKRSPFATVSNVSRRAWRTLNSLSLFQKMNVAFAALGLTMLVGFASQEFQLRQRFQEDFRVQLAAPPVLARGVPQTISATTTGPNGKPRRVPLRFCFTDAKTGKFLLAHTEGGDASGVARFDVPDVSKFPERTRLTISVGERDAKTVETLETILPVVDGNVSRRDAAEPFDAVKILAASEQLQSDADAKIEELSSDPIQTPPIDASQAKIAARTSAKPSSLPSESEILSLDAETAGAVAPDAATALGANDDKSSRKTSPQVAQWDRAFSNSANNFNAQNNDASPIQGEEFASDESASTVATVAMNEEPQPTDSTTERARQRGLAPPFARAASTQSFVEARLFDVDSKPALSANAPTPTSADSVVEPAIESETDSRAESASPLPTSSTAAQDAEHASVRRLDSKPTFRFFPEGGRLVAGLENRVWFSCVDSTGAPVAGTFALKKSTETELAKAEPTASEDSAAPSPIVDPADWKARVLLVETSENGVGSFALTPELDETYLLERVGAASTEQPPLAALSNDASFESPTIAELPAAETRRVVFSAFSKVVSPGAPLSLDVETTEKTPLAATVEKNGVVVSQTVWTANEGRRRIALPVPENVCGLLTVSLYLCEGTPLEKIGDTSFYRKSSSTLDAELSLSFDGEGAPTLNVLTTEPRGEQNRDGSIDPTSQKQENVRLDVVWAPTRADAVAFLSVDEALSRATDSAKEEFLGTIDAGNRLTVPPPIIFDNLIGMKKRVLSKLTNFWQIETRIASNVVLFGFFGCVVLSGLAIFFVIFRALSFGRGALVVGCCCALAAFFQFERKTIDFSSALSKSIAFSVAEDEKSAVGRAASEDNGQTTTDERAKIWAQNPAFFNEFQMNWMKTDALTAQSNDGEKTTRIVFSRLIRLGDSFRLQLDDVLTVDESQTGVLLVKIAQNESASNGKSNWVILDATPRN